MGRFNEYPYVNYNEYNLDWILKKMRELIDAWIQLNKDNEKFKNDMVAAFEDLKKYVDDYFDNLDVSAEVKEAIDNEIDELINSGYFLRVLENNAKGVIAANLISEYSCKINDFEDRPSGMCYVGSGQYVFYTRSHATGEYNQGWLCCLDIDTQLIVWRYKHTMYHGNTICYNPTNNCVYISSTIDDNSNPTHDIYKVNLNNPNVIAETIVPADGMYCSNIAFDDVTGYFYIVGGRNNYTGVAYEFTDEFQTLNRVINLEQNYYSSDLMDSYYQGCTITGSTLYQLYFNAYQCVVGYDLQDGHMTIVGNMPSEVSKCKKVHEYEDITFDFDRNVFTVNGVTRAGRYHNTPVMSLVDLGLAGEIPIRYPRYVFNSNAIDEISVEVGSIADCTPANIKTNANGTPIFRSIVDAEVYSNSKEVGQVAKYAVRDSEDGSVAYLSNITFINDFEIRPSSGFTLRLVNADITRPKNMVLRGNNDDTQALVVMCSSVGGSTATNALLSIGYGQSLYLDNVKFSCNIVPDYPYGISCGIGSYVKQLRGVSIYGTYTDGHTIYYAESGAKIDLLGHNYSGAQVSQLIYNANRQTNEIDAFFEAYAGSLTRAGTEETFTSPINRQSLIIMCYPDYRNQATVVPYMQNTDATISTKVFIAADNGILRGNITFSNTGITLTALSLKGDDGTSTNVDSLTVKVLVLNA